jgi:5-methylcytosine-specific restriction endonuclease McrBC regulatory subunit McrC
VLFQTKEHTPILKISKGSEENKVLITTFGYVGKFSMFSVTFNIGYRFGNRVLDRMVAKVNDIEVNSIELEAKHSAKKYKHDNLVMRMLYMHFILKLEKLSILGLPKSYVRVEHHDRFRGQIDINRYIKKDIPFQGKISSVSYEQNYVQEILDLLYNALDVVEDFFKELVMQRIFQTRNLLHHHANRVIVDESTISKALNHKVLHNALYSEFKTTLELASYIVRNNFNIEHNKSNFLNGLIFDVSTLWELYLYKLLKEKFEKDGWVVHHEEECLVYEGNFYKRRMLPDIVIKNEELQEVVVFDAKSKVMRFRAGLGDGGRGDLDRYDFFQIHTYMSYYQQQGYKVLAGGLLYPMDMIYDKEKCFSDSWFGNNATKFVVDGLELKKSKSFKGLVCRERRFLKRIEQLLKGENDER